MWVWGTCKGPWSSSGVRAGQTFVRQNVKDRGLDGSKDYAILCHKMSLPWTYSIYLCSFHVHSMFLVDAGLGCAVYFKSLGVSQDMGRIVQVEHVYVLGDHFLRLYLHEGQVDPDALRTALRKTWQSDRSVSLYGRSWYVEGGMFITSVQCRKSEKRFESKCLAFAILGRTRCNKMHDVIIRSILLKKNANKNQTPPVLPPPFPVTPLGFVRLSHFCAEELKMSCRDVSRFGPLAGKTTIVPNFFHIFHDPRRKWLFMDQGLQQTLHQSLEFWSSMGARCAALWCLVQLFVWIPCPKEEAQMVLWC